MCESIVRRSLHKNSPDLFSRYFLANTRPGFEQELRIKLFGSKFNLAAGRSHSRFEVSMRNCASYWRLVPEAILRGRSASAPQHRLYAGFKLSQTKRLGNYRIVGAHLEPGTLSTTSSLA